MVGGRGPTGELWNCGTQQLVGNGATDEGGVVLNCELKSQEVLGGVVWTLPEAKWKENESHDLLRKKCKCRERGAV